MIGTKKLSTIRAEVRKAFKVSEAELRAWFNRQLRDLEQEPKINKVEIDTLGLLRDALAKDAKRSAPKRNLRRAKGASRTGRR